MIVCFISGLLWFIIILLGVFLFTGENVPEKIPTCGDGAFYETCSLMKPYFCLEGVLVERASVCGCVDDLTKVGDFCVSKYQTNPKEVILKYLMMISV